MAWRTGTHYTLIRVRRSRISVHTVPVELVKRVEKELRKRGAVSVGELTRSLGCSSVSASRALQVLHVEHLVSIPVGPVYQPQAECLVQHVRRARQLLYELRWQLAV